MAADLAEVAADLPAWLATLETLTAEPDIAPGPGTRTKPGSRPPWNPENAMLLFEAAGVLADIRLEFAHHVHGRYVWRPGYTHLPSTLDAIVKLGAAVPDDMAARAVRTINQLITRIAQVPAIDIEERPRRIRVACKYCQFKMMVLRPRSWQVTCLRRGACFDDLDQHPVGELRAYHDGSAAIFWADGTITIPERSDLEQAA